MLEFLLFKFFLLKEEGANSSALRMLFQGCVLRTWDPLQLYWGWTMPLPYRGWVDSVSRPHVPTKHLGYVPNRAGTFTRPAELHSRGKAMWWRENSSFSGGLNPSGSIFFLPQG